MSEAKDRNNVDCYCAKNRDQNQLEGPLMVQLVELNWLSVKIQVNSCLELLFTLSIRKILVRLRAMETPCIREKSQTKTNCMVIARGVGRGAQNIDISLLPHCENRISGYENIAYISHFYL